jgi:hypothetical protein
MAVTELEIMWGRRAFPRAQELLRGSPKGLVAGATPVGWYAENVHPEVGAFALVSYSAGLDDLVGDVLRVSVPGAEVFVYVLGVRGLPQPVCLARRAFMALTSLHVGELDAAVEVVG